MSFYPLRYLPTGHVFIDPEDDCHRLVDALLGTGYNEEFCLAKDFDEVFFSRLMEAGFLIMSMNLNDGKDTAEAEHTAENDTRDSGETAPAPFYIVLPKLHIVRSVLLFPDLYIKKSIRRLLDRYELRVNSDFDFLLDRCIEVHGSAWLTPPLAATLKNMRRMDMCRMDTHRMDMPARPFSFAVYRDGKLRAGEIGVVSGRVYTSYSGYHDEDNAGTVQMILMTEWLKETGFDFLDFGMPLEYKTALGARDVTPRCFVEMFRAAH